MKSSLLAAVAFSALATEDGQKTVCIGPRAYLLTWKIEGEGNTLQTLDNADIELSRFAENDQSCAGSGNDKLFCFGANTDDTCSGPRASLPLTNNFECANCWAGVTADFYYKVTTTFGVPTRAEIGVRNTKIAGALQLHAHGGAAAELASGSINLPSPEAHINFMAGKIPVNLTLSLPLRLDYNLGLKGALDARAGAELNIDLGDHSAALSPKGIHWTNTPTSFAFEPVLTVDTGDSGADMGLTLAGALHAEADDMVSYNMNIDAAVPSTIRLEKGESLLPHKFCLETDVDAPVRQEAEVYKRVFGKKVPLFHYGPAEILHFRKERALYKCLGSSSEVV